MGRHRSRHAESLLKIIAPLRRPGMQGAEIGVLKGRTSQALLEELPELFMWMVDVWSEFPAGSTYHQSRDYVASLSQSEHLQNLEDATVRTSAARDRRLIVRADSAVAAQGIKAETLDFVFIDAEHSYDAVRSDISKWWNKVRPGGILAGHNYGGRKNRRGIWGVNQAVDEFVARQQLQLGRQPDSVWWVTKPKLREQESVGSRTSQIVRVVFGDLTANMRVRREIESTLTSAWTREETTFFVAGAANADWLAGQGVKRIELILAEHTPPEASRYGFWYAKTLLMAQAMERYDEILFLDFDARAVRSPDQAMWDRLRAPRAGQFGGALQALNVGYRNPVCLSIHRERGRHPIRRCLNSSVVYCREKRWLRDWLDAYEDVARRGISLTITLDETFLMHLLDREFGVFDAATMVREFEIPIAWLHRATPEARLCKRREDAYFIHR